MAVREARLRVTARCEFENVLWGRFDELLQRIGEAYPEADIQPLESDVKVRAATAPVVLWRLRYGRALESEYPGAMQKCAEQCGLTMEQAEEILALCELGIPPSGFLSRKEDPVTATEPALDYRRNALELRRTALIEEYQAASDQMSRELSEVNRVKLRRQIVSLERDISSVEADLAALGGCQD